MIWALVTFPSFRREREKNNFYKEKEAIVDPLLNNILQINTMANNSYEIIEKQINEILHQLEKVGFDNNKKVKLVAPKFNEK